MAFAEFIQHPSSKVAVAPTIDGHEIGGRRQRAEIRVNGDRCDALPGAKCLADNLSEVRLIEKRGQGACLGDTVHAEMVSHPIEAFDQSSIAQGKAYSRSSETLGLGESPETQYLRIADIDGRRGALRSKF
jgi:hypothetical protein